MKKSYKKKERGKKVQHKVEENKQNGKSCILIPALRASVWCEWEEWNMGLIMMVDGSYSVFLNGVFQHKNEGRYLKDKEAESICPTQLCGRLSSSN